MIKTILFCTLIAGIQVTSIEFPDQLIEEPFEKCMLKLDIDKTILSKIFEENFQLKYPYDLTTKFVGCLLDWVPFFKDDGEFNQDLIISRLVIKVKLFVKEEIGEAKAKELAEEMYDECKGSKGDDLIEKVINIHNCCMSALKKKAKVSF